MSEKKFMDSVPVLDLGNFTSSNPQDKLKFVNDLGEAFKDIGFVVIKNHGFTTEIQANIYQEVERFFNLPDDVKLKYDGSFCGGQRGYTGKGKEHAAGQKVGDLKEFFQVGKHIRDSESAHYQANIFPTEVPDLQKFALLCYQTLENIGLQILKAIALHLNLPEDHFDTITHNGISILRAIHYFPITSMEMLKNNAVRAAEHGDINLITLLMGASAEGLQVKNRNNQWINIQTQPGEIVVNVGDMLERYTNKVLKSTIHRVVNPPNTQLNKARYSIPFFMHANPEASLACLPSCITPQNPKQFEDITAGDFLMQRLKEIGLIK